jgi:hypothetical protein
MPNSDQSSPPNSSVPPAATSPSSRRPTGSLAVSDWPRHPGTPAPRHPGTPAPRHPGTPGLGKDQWQPPQAQTLRSTAPTRLLPFGALSLEVMLRLARLLRPKTLGREIPHSGDALACQSAAQCPVGHAPRWHHLQAGSGRAAPADRLIRCVIKRRLSGRTGL